MATLLIGACQGTPTLGPQACAAALLEGTLVADGQDLVVATSFGTSYPVVWPDGVHVGSVDGRPAVIGFFGQTIAREGDFVSMGGGYAPRGEFFQACGEIRFEPIGS